METKIGGIQHNRQDGSRYFMPTNVIYGRINEINKLNDRETSFGTIPRDTLSAPYIQSQNCKKILFESKLLGENSMTWVIESYFEGNGFAKGKTREILMRSMKQYGRQEEGVIELIKMLPLKKRMRFYEKKEEVNTRPGRIWAIYGAVIDKAFNLEFNTEDQEMENLFQFCGVRSEIIRYILVEYKIGEGGIEAWLDLEKTVQRLERWGKITIREQLLKGMLYRNKFFRHYKEEILPELVDWVVAGIQKGRHDSWKANDHGNSIRWIEPHVFAEVVGTWLDIQEGRNVQDIINMLQYATVEQRYQLYKAQEKREKLEKFLQEQGINDLCERIFYGCAEMSEQENEVKNLLSCFQIYGLKQNQIIEIIQKNLKQNKNTGMLGGVIELICNLSIEEQEKFFSRYQKKDYKDYFLSPVWKNYGDDISRAFQLEEVGFDKQEVEIIKLFRACGVPRKKIVDEILKQGKWQWNKLGNFLENETVQEKFFLELSRKKSETGFLLPYAEEIMPSIIDWIKSYTANSNENIKDANIGILIEKMDKNMFADIVDNWITMRQEKTINDIKSALQYATDEQIEQLYKDRSKRKKVKKFLKEEEKNNPDATNFYEKIFYKCRMRAKREKELRNLLLCFQTYGLKRGEIKETLKQNLEQNEDTGMQQGIIALIKKLSRKGQKKFLLTRKHKDYFLESPIWENYGESILKDHYLLAEHLRSHYGVKKRNNLKLLDTIEEEIEEE